MDSGSLLTAIALAAVLHLQPPLANISYDVLARAQLAATLCQPLEIGMPCLSLEPADETPVARSE